MSTSETDAAPQSLDPESLNASQRERRRRIIAAASELASEGGFHGVQMRDVAEKADVALGTLYRYFPSKIHLLIGALRDQTDTLRASVARRPPQGDTAEERVLDLLQRGTKPLERNPQLTGAVLRALMTGEADASIDAAATSDNMTTLIVNAIQDNGDDPTEDQLAMARVLQQVWSSSLMSWLSGRSSSRELHENLEVATRLLLRNAP